MHPSRAGPPGVKHRVSGAESVVLGRYRLRERLGAGGFGVVWRAYDELLHREVAVKWVPLAPEGDSERASREALATARLAHPAIVALYEACAVEDAFYLISELVDGETLAQLIAADTLADEEVLEIGIALAGALSHAHARGVIHRDVKPQNVLVPYRLAEPASTAEALAGVAKLTDFGGARLAGEDVLTRTGDVLGTLAYMAPEQSEGREAGEAADLYSLALVLYEALCGVNPVRGSTPAATARRIGCQLAPLERRRGDLPRTLTRALDEALSSSPTDRGTLGELRLVLEETLEGGLRRPRRGRRRQPHVEPEDRAVAAWLPSPPRQAFPGTRIVPKRRLLSHSTPIEEGPPVRDEELAITSPRRPALPRKLWLACALAAIVWQAWAGRPGAALLLLAAITPPIVWPRGRRSVGFGLGWLTSALAPVLGLVGLAGAFPAVAGQATRWSERAALAALGYWWLTLSEPLLTRRLWLGPPPGTPAHAVWEGSLGSAATHVVGPVLSVGVLLGAASWATAAVLLPWLVRGRSAAFDVVAATIWSAALAAAAPVLDSGLSVHAVHPSPRGVVLGSVLGGVIAVAARALRGPVRRPRLT